MWTLFVPGTHVIAKPFLGTNQIFEVFDPLIPWDPNLPTKLYVIVRGWDYDGKSMVRVYYELSIDKFRGTKDINELECFPIMYYKNAAGEYNKEELCQTITAREKKYVEYVNCPQGATQMHSHDGNAVSERRNAIKTEDDEDYRSHNDEGSETKDASRTVRKTVPITGTYLVDAGSFLQYGGGDHVLDDLEPWWKEEVEEQPDDQKSSGDSSYLLYPPRILGYSTEKKTWAQFSVDRTKPAKKGDKSMFRSKLQLEDRYKRMIQALVENHTNRPRGDSSERNEVRDVVKNKGQGLVLLLHGPPGVGKTLTAETIAEATNKPLLIVSVAEIGLNASKAERNLKQMFQLAGRWEAILLV